MYSPSTRRNSSTDPITLNLVPIIDMMVAIIGFLLFTTAFFNITSIPTPMPMASTAENQKQLKEKPLQLTLSLGENEAEIWSPFDRIEKKVIPDLTPGQPNVNAIHDALMGIKKTFPGETKIVLVPNSGSTYDVLISVMDAARMLDPTDPAIFQKNPATGIDEPVKQLFPDVIFGNLLGDSG